MSDNNNDLQNDYSNNEQIEVNSDEQSKNQSDKEQSKVGSDDEFDIYGHITAYDNSSITINKVNEEDFGEGKGIASGSVENPNLQMVYITETTKYTQKDIYDVNGNRVETREASKEDLKVDTRINIKGYQSDNKLYATEIVIENSLYR